MRFLCHWLLAVYKVQDVAVDLTKMSGFQVGLFRKSGVKSRIQALRQMNESSPDNVNYEDQSAYDVADMVKQFFRDLPDPLLTSKLGETFLHIYQCKYINISQPVALKGQVAIELFHLFKVCKML